VSDRDDAGLTDDGFEPVHVENDWYDGPWCGLADVGGVAHYFHRVDYVAGDGDLDEYFVWPATTAALAWEREQWAIFVEWNTRYEAGTATVDSHPGHRGVSARYDELNGLLTPHRTVPDDARRLVAEWRWLHGPSRYHVNGVDYRVRWRPTT
jgi:hypothetical protein